MLCDHLPRERFCHLPTPLEFLPRLTEALGGPQIYIKRDDRTGLSFGGNKPRIFEFIFGDMLQKKCDVIITASGVQSNHLREVCSAANRLGLRSIIVLVGASGQEVPQGNLLLCKLLGAEIHTVENPDYFSDEVTTLLDSLVRREESRGHKPYLQHRHNHTGTINAVAHVHAAEELHEQCRQMGIASSRIIVPTGSGATTAGYVLGLAQLGGSARVMGIGLTRPNAVMVPEIHQYIRKSADYIGLNTTVAEGDFDNLDQYVGKGHGILTPAVSEAIRLMARSEGLFLDPTYTGKTLAALIDQIRSGGINPSETIVFVHTGGLPALFVDNLALARE